MYSSYSLEKNVCLLIAFFYPLPYFIVIKSYVLFYLSGAKFAQ